MSGAGGRLGVAEGVRGPFGRLDSCVALPWR
jgi:hypothetical protein